MDSLYQHWKKNNYNNMVDHQLTPHPLEFDGFWFPHSKHTCRKMSTFEHFVCLRVALLWTVVSNCHNLPEIIWFCDVLKLITIHFTWFLFLVSACTLLNFCETVIDVGMISHFPKFFHLIIGRIYSIWPNLVDRWLLHFCCAGG